MTIGVPEGSILKSILFDIFVSEIMFVDYTSLGDLFICSKQRPHRLKKR